MHTYSSYTISNWGKGLQKVTCIYFAEIFTYEAENITCELRDISFMSLPFRAHVLYTAISKNTYFFILPIVILQVCNARFSPILTTQSTYCSYMNTSVHCVQEFARTSTVNACLVLILFPDNLTLQPERVERHGGYDRHNYMRIGTKFANMR